MSPLHDASGQAPETGKDCAGRGLDRVCFVTISTRSHWPGAQLALRSAMEQTPGVVGAVLLLDGDSGALPPHEGIRILEPAQCVTEPALAQMRARYTPAELCFALKPFVIRALFEAGMEQVHYVDGDIRVYADLTPLIEGLAGHDVLLTPHYLTPVPEDGRQPHVLNLLRAGVFNGGYISVRDTAEGRRFAEWWGRQVQRYGHSDPWAGMCGDQRWLDLVPALFPGAAILRHAGANVAYWNVHERRLDILDGRFVVDSQPLLFFHFSGFDPHRPAVFSCFQDRVDVASQPVLARLLADYADALLALGYDEFRQLGYAHARWWHSNARFIRILRTWYFRLREGLL